MRHLVLSLIAFSIVACGDQDKQDANDPENIANIDRNSQAGSAEQQGIADAPAINIVEYCSMTSVRCAELHRSFGKKLILLAGKNIVRYEFHAIVTPPIQVSEKGASTVICIRERGAESNSYQAAINKLFAQQRSWAFGENTDGALTKIAAEYGVEEDVLVSCWNEPDLMVLSGGNAAQIETRPTNPTIFLNGVEFPIESQEDVSAFILRFDELTSKI